MPIQFENTDTFGGEANYCWVKRHTLPAQDNSLSDRALMRKAKAWAGYTGMRGRVDRYGDTIAFRPYRICQVLFISYVEGE